MVGVYWPQVQVAFGQSVGALGLVSLVYGIGRMSTALAGRALLQRMSMGPAFLVALLALATASLAVAGSTTWVFFLVAIAAVGIVSGLLDSLGAIFITTLGDVGSSGLIHGMYGLGATVGPLIVIIAPTWRWSALAGAAVVGGATVVAASARNAWPPPVPVAVTVGREAEPVNPVVILASLGAFASLVALEVTTGQWAYIYLTESRLFDEDLAAVAVSGFWAGLMVGRLLMSRPRIALLVDRTGTVKLSLAALAGVVGVAVLPPFVAVGALVFAGMTLGPLIPTLFARTRERVGEFHAARMAGRQLLATNMGAIGVPFLTGLLVDASDPGVIIVVVVVVLGGVALPLLATLRRVAPV
jgi:fucose permease